MIDEGPTAEQNGPEKAAGLQAGEMDSTATPDAVDRTAFTGRGERAEHDAFEGDGSYSRGEFAGGG